MKSLISPEPGHPPEERKALQFNGKMARLVPLFKKWLLPLVLFVLVELAVLGGLLNRQEMSLYDVWFRLQGVRDPGDRVVIVALDEASVDKIGPLAWPRSVHAGLLEKLKEARVVGFDIVFDVPTNPEGDKALAQSVAEHGRVVLASEFVFERNEAGEMEQVFKAPLPEILEGAAGLGFVNTPTDPDKVVRRITAVDLNTFVDESTAKAIPFPSFGMAVAMAAFDLNPLALELSPNHLTIGDKVIPIDQLNRAMPAFWGPMGTFHTYSYVDVLEGKIPASEFKDKIVLVGVGNIPAAHDVWPTPYTTSNLVLSGSLDTPGVEIHASTVQSFIDGRWYRQANPAVNLAFLLLAGLMTGVAVTGRGPWLGLAGALVVVAAAAGTAFGLWWHARLWLDLAAPLALIFLTYAVVTAADFVQAEMGRRRTRAMFGRYVSPAVVEELMQNPGDVALGGRRQELTVVFCDIRGFTAYSENKAPEEVVSRLNEYLTAMTQVIFRHGGMLDKYLGDGLMAIFGAPVYYPDHVRRAVQSAVEIQEVIEKLNHQWAEKNEPPLKIGVGINSGSVLVGNVGSPDRMDYTVIGEDVNLASRVEGLTKTFNTLIVISERSIRMLEGEKDLPWELQYLGHAEVKGFTLPVGVYTAVAGSKSGKDMFKGSME